MAKVYIGRQGDGERVWVEAKIDEAGELHIVGEVYAPSGNLSDGNIESCGQTRNDLRRVVDFADGWNSQRRDRLADIWDRWHLNHMNAGCPHQESHIRETGEQLIAYSRNVAFYCFDCDYYYGSAWLKEELPQDVIDFIKGLE